MKKIHWEEDKEKFYSVQEQAENLKGGKQKIGALIQELLGCQPPSLVFALFL